jgi:hypothetical protein
MTMSNSDGRKRAAEAMHDADGWNRILAELDHAGVNGHILDRDCQGVGPGERVDAVRASSILAVLRMYGLGEDTTDD